MFRTVCPNCFKEYTLDDVFLNKPGTCAECRTVFILKEPTQTRHLESGVTYGNENNSDFDLQLPSVGDDALPDDSEASVVAATRTTDGSGVWEIGDVICGIYEVRQLAPGTPFAEGGVGVVHRIHHREWDLDLAVKSPKPEVFITEGGKLSYEREAQTWIELGLHANIVTCYLVRRIDNIPRLFAEFVPDGSLRDWMRDGRLYVGGPEISLLRIIDIAIQCARGLQHAHRRKLLHLDVKPANVMMSGQVAKVTDFGLAQGISANIQPGTGEHPVISAQNKKAADSGLGLVNIGEDTKANEGVGMNLLTGGMTPGYCSPEQYLTFTALQSGEDPSRFPKITLHSDIWSWAVSILALFHGRPPCRKGGQTARKVFELFLQNETPKDRPRIPEPLVELLFHCFEEQPDRRPESMEWIAERLTAMYRDFSGQSYPRPKPISAGWTPETINNRAASMLDLDKPQEAVSLLAKAAKMQPWHPEVTYNQTLLAWRSSKITDMDALERLETLVKTRPKSPIAFYALGLLQRERGNPQSALDAFENGLEWEDRPELCRAALAVEPVVPKACRCVERLMLAPGTDAELHIEEREEFFFLPTGRETFSIRETQTGRERLTFKHSAAPEGERFAISDNLQYELVSLGSKKGIGMRRVGAPAFQGIFRPIAWQRGLGPGVDAEKTGYAAVERDGVIDLVQRSNQQKIGDLFGHEGKVTALAFGPECRWAITGGVDRTIRVWELPSCRCVRTFPSLGGSVDALYFGKNRKFALSLIAGGSLRIWDLELLTGNETSFHAPILLSLVSSSEEVSRQQAEMNDRCDEIRQAVLREDYKAALEAIDRAKNIPIWESVRSTLDIWDAITRHCRKVEVFDALCLHSFVGHHDTISSVALSLDSGITASAGADHTIRVWNVPEDRCLAVLQGHGDWIRSISMTQDTKYIVSGSWDSTVRIWNTASGQCMRVFGERIKTITRVQLHPQGRLIAIANAGGAVILWDPMSNTIPGRFQAHDGSVNALRFSRDGRYLITGGDDGQVHVWELATCRAVRSIKHHKQAVTAVQLTTDLSRSVSGSRDGRLVIWDLHTNKLRNEQTVHMGDITMIENIADDRFIATSGKDGKVRITPSDGGTSRVIEGHPGPITSLAFDISGRRYATGCDDAVVRLWDVSWRYEFDGIRFPDERTDAYLRVLLSLFTPDPEGRERPTINEAIRKRIRTEMEYRGFGDIDVEAMKNRIDTLIEGWPNRGRVVLET